MLFGSKKVHCLDCAFEGDFKKGMKGSIFIEIILWLCMIVPGLIYSIWRHTSGRYNYCPDCKSEKLLPLEKWHERQKSKSA